MQLACDTPEVVDRPVNTWTPRELIGEAVKRGIVEQISPRTVERSLTSWSTGCSIYYVGVKIGCGILAGYLELNFTRAETTDWEEGCEGAM